MLHLLKVSSREKLWTYICELVNVGTQQVHTVSIIDEAFPKLTLKAPERLQWRRFNVFIVNFKHISYIILVHYSGWVDFIHLVNAKTLMQ